MPLVMPNAATGSQGRNLMSLVNIIANSSAFQQRRDVVTDIEALPHIYYPWLRRFDSGESLEGKLPWAVVEVPDDAFQWDGPRNALFPHGTFNLVLADIDRLPQDQVASYVDFLNFVDGVLYDIAQASDTDDNISITSMVQLNAPGISDEKDWGAVPPFWMSRYALTWHAKGGGE